MTARRRDDSLKPIGRSILLAAGWGLGVGAGVALGAVLTAVSGTGSPGLQGVDVSLDLVIVPLAAGSAVFLAYLASVLVLEVVRGRRAAQVDAQPDDGEQGEAEKGVDGQVGTEVETSQD
ncbi:MAG TPA: hypothetical protein VF902_07895 [Coriobacteriia bacterium]